MYLYRIKFYDLRDVLHEVNVLAGNGAHARCIVWEYFPDAQIFGVFRFDRDGCDVNYFIEERSVALNAYKYGFTRK